MNWTFDDSEADWIAKHLTHFWSRRLSGTAPVGFPAYGRMLHPASTHDGRLVRWSQVAQQNGTGLTSTSDFLHVALPEQAPTDRPVWTGNRPHIGSLIWPQAARLMEVLRPHTRTPDHVSFALWDGLGWDHATMVSPDHPPQPAPDPIPQMVRSGPRILIPGRDYLYCSGPLEDALAWMPRQHQTPHLWWPKDHAWAVAGDVDLPWTIIAGPSDLIDQLAGDSLLEVLPLAEDTSLDPKPPWLEAWITDAVRDLMSSHGATIATPLGSVSFRMSEDGVWFESSGGGRSRIPPAHPRRSLEDYLSSEGFSHLIGALGLY